MRVGIDIDDTLCPFMELVVPWVRENYEINTKFGDYCNKPLHQIWNVAEDVAVTILKKFIYSDIYFPPYEGSQEVLNHFKDKFEFYAITARDYELTDSTKIWLNTHYPGVFKDVVICNTYGMNNMPRYCKTAKCKELGITLFIDDRPENIICSSIRTVVYAQPWNISSTKERVNSWGDIFLILLTENLKHQNVKIGISGKIGSGKSTVAKIIKSVVPEINRLAFATKVKETAAVLTGCDISMFYTREGKSTMFKPFGKTLGQILQDMSEALKTTFGNDMWVNLLTDNDFCLIEDVRFKVEANKIGTLLRIEGDPCLIREKNEDGRDLNHISETDLDDYPFEHIIHNNGSLEDLSEQVMEFLFSL